MTRRAKADYDCGMKTPLRRQLRLLQAYAALSFCALVFLSVTALGQVPGSQKIDELTVQRINVVDANGTLRLVISNKDRMHPGVIDGVTLNRPRPVAGMIFFNDEGDEVGGLTMTGSDDHGRRADARLTFDQLKQDQIVGLIYSEGDGQRSAGFQVWDRPDQPLSDLIRAMNAANALPAGPGRDQAVAAVEASALQGAGRVFVGKNRDRAATVSLADAAGKPRLVLKVNSDGGATIDFLDAEGKIVQRIPSK